VSGPEFTQIQMVAGMLLAGKGAQRPGLIQRCGGGKVVTCLRDVAQLMVCSRTHAQRDKTKKVILPALRLVQRTLPGRQCFAQAAQIDSQ
jgi:hypothetical protein